ncbi:beta-ketoacyl-[acyl-carrier-protein] synthase family protein [Leptolyngbya sp. 7M]|uniref:beta-ketoacyl-[acyl-carrier-protein] synthase family protein n=1 Tax=Leptolyngbya sp. 7M TaxID=2812896 RepID=UPI001B8AE392|nr:beta-ketoacyl-[acyl-carrier-protein] synthase family protein [Leptolyngbya sp. 7M]QYO65916.1 beta-ketoacyl-[acyl-carrier-protein] synthase family protein [Leptolyngbya sp. 7M]
MLNQLKTPRRVVITGFGCVTPIGIGKDEFWKSLSLGKSGTRLITSFDPTPFKVQIAAEIPEFDWRAELAAKDRQHVPRTVPLAIAASREAMADSHLLADELTAEERGNFGVVLGTGGGGLSFTEKQFGFWFSGNAGKGSIYTIPASTHGGLSSELSMFFGLHGLSHVVSTGCTSSTDAIFYAAQHIAFGRQDRMLAGGVDSPISPGILKGFEVMGVCTKEWNAEPERASRPFSADRSGMVIGEGAWIFVIEELEAALQRGAKVYAEIIGYGSTCDAYHRVRLEENGVEPARAMKLAMDDAGITPQDIDYVNLHGTSTLLNDRIETKAIKAAFGEYAYKIPMSATKSQIGHPQGAAGAAGVAATLFAINGSVVPPTINLDLADAECDLDYVPNFPREHSVRIALCNCIGFGSKNSALILRSIEP